MTVVFIQGRETDDGTLSSRKVRFYTLLLYASGTETLQRKSIPKRIHRIYNWMSSMVSEHVTNTGILMKGAD